MTWRLFWLGWAIPVVVALVAWWTSTPGDPFVLF